MFGLVLGCDGLFYCVSEKLGVVGGVVFGGYGCVVCVYWGFVF